MDVNVVQNKSTITVDQTNNTVTVQKLSDNNVTIKIGGIQGPPGLGAVDALAVANRLSEFDTEQAKAAARGNLDLQDIDLGTFN